MFTVREGSCDLHGLAFEADPPQCVHGGTCQILVTVCAAPEPVGMTSFGLYGEDHVLQHGHVVDDAGDLKRSSHAQVWAPVGRHVGNVIALESDLT